MIKIKISYENEEELEKFLQLVKDKTAKVKISRNSNGQFKKAYIVMKDH